MLGVDVEKRLGDFSLRARFQTGNGVTAVFGPSGAGKTTLVKLLVGLYRPQKGNIFYNGTPEDEIAIESLRAAIHLKMNHDALPWLSGNLPGYCTANGSCECNLDCLSMISVASLETACASFARSGRV